MKNNNLDKIRIMEQEKINGEFYFQSLLEQAFSKGLLSDSDIERMKYDCLSLLARKTESYNAGDSSSIQVEKAQSIMTSILFTIGLWLKTFQNPDDAVKVLLNETINELYQKGRKRIDTMLAATKAVHKKLLHQLVDTPNVYYRATLKEGISGFFKLYYPDYSAQEIHITADYPLFNPIPELAGIEFIKTYVETAYYENRFCNCFSANDIHHLLCGYAEDYQSLLINIYELVLTAAIGCIIAGTDVYSLDISQAGVHYLYQAFVGLSKCEILALISKAADELNCRFQFSPGLARYTQNSLPLIAGKIEIAVCENTLTHVFFTPAFPEKNPKIVFSFGVKMDDEQYRKVVEQIKQCSFLQDKVSIIKEHIHSLADLEDILLDADLLQNEIHAVLRELSLPEIAALSKRHQLQSDIGTFELREQEQLLRKSLQGFISALPQKHQDLIVQASNAMREE